MLTHYHQRHLITRRLLVLHGQTGLIHPVQPRQTPTTDHTQFLRLMRKITLDHYQIHSFLNVHHWRVLRMSKFRSDTHLRRKFTVQQRTLHTHDLRLLQSIKCSQCFLHWLQNQRSRLLHPLKYQLQVLLITMLKKELCKILYSALYLLSKFGGFINPISWQIFILAVSQKEK